MQLDLPTISAVNMTVTAILGVVLLLTWARERESRLIGWWGLALLVQAAGLSMMPVLFSANLPLAVAGALFILGDGVKWKAAREFANRRRTVSGCFSDRSVTCSLCNRAFCTPSVIA